MKIQSDFNLTHVSARRNRILLSLIFFIGTGCFAQQRVTAFVLDEENFSPVPFASVVSEKGMGVMADSAGKFSFLVSRKAMLRETIRISASGFTPKQLLVNDLLGTDQVLMQKEEVLLDDVKVFSSVKADPRTVGFYRVWSDKRKGGEIGFIFDMPEEKILLDKVQLKINHNYYSCSLRLHIRDVSTLDIGYPRNELLKKETDITFTKSYGMVDFNLDWEEFTIPGKKLYIGFELLGCDSSFSSIPSFFFLGNESGKNFYRDSANLPWEEGGDYTIYIRFTYKNADD